MAVTERVEYSDFSSLFFAGRNGKGVLPSKLLLEEMNMLDVACIMHPQEDGTSSLKKRTYLL